MSRTIAAISTPAAPAGLGVLRVSGDDAVAVAARVFRPARAGKRLEDAAGYTAQYGYVFDADGDIDDAVALSPATPPNTDMCLMRTATSTMRWRCRRLHRPIRICV